MPPRQEYYRPHQDIRDPQQGSRLPHSELLRRSLFISLQMPKGALLHAHLDAMVNAEFLLKLALKYPVFHVRVHQPLTVANLPTNLPEFRALSEDLFTHSASLTDAGYAIGTWIPIGNARQSFDAEFGGPEGFDKWVLAAMTINPAEAYGTHNTVAKVRPGLHTTTWDLLKQLDRYGKSSPALSSRPMSVFPPSTCNRLASQRTGVDSLPAIVCRVYKGVFSFCN